jgi:hypothetical protein
MKRKKGTDVYTDPRGMPMMEVFLVEKGIEKRKRKAKGRNLWWSRRQA